MWPDNSSSSFSIDFCKIHGLHSNFHSLERHLSTKLQRFIHTKTQFYEATDSNLSSVPSNFLFRNFRSKLDIAFIWSTASLAFMLTNSTHEFHNIWWKISCHSLIKYMWAVSLPSSFTNYTIFFDYINFRMNHILTEFLFSEVNIYWDINIHHQLCLFFFLHWQTW